MSEQFVTASELLAATERITLLEDEINRLRGLVTVRHCKTLLLQELRATYKAFPSIGLCAKFESATNFPRTRTGESRVLHENLDIAQRS